MYLRIYTWICLWPIGSSQGSICCGWCMTSCHSDFLMCLAGVHACGVPRPHPHRLQLGLLPKVLPATEDMILCFAICPLGSMSLYSFRVRKLETLLAFLSVKMSKNRLANTEKDPRALRLTFRLTLWGFWAFDLHVTNVALGVGPNLLRFRGIWFLGIFLGFFFFIVFIVHVDSLGKRMMLSQVARQSLQPLGTLTGATCQGVTWQIKNQTNKRMQLRKGS